MMDGATNFPLSWPEGWKRTTANSRTRGQFGTTKRGGPKEPLTVADAADRLCDELERLGVRLSSAIISTNVQPTLSGRPRSGQSEPSDPGVAVYWSTKSGQRCMAIDRYDRVADNLAAIAATLEAMRAIERHGGAEILDRAFTGFASLPASAGQGKREWWAVFGVSANASDADIEAAYRRLAKERHPDTGGSDDAMAELNQARDEWRKSKSLTP